MSRVINPETAGKQRNQLIRGIVLALRELSGQSQPDDKTRDLAAFISLALLNIYDSLDTSVAAWEKRGYWLKADRYRMEWSWTGRLGKQIGGATLEDDWADVAVAVAEVAEKLSDVKLPAKNRLGSPWVGAWAQLQKEASRITTPLNS